jgi:Zn-dependent protease with chaperone function
MPGRLRWLAWCAGAFAVSTAAVAAVVVSTPDAVTELAVFPVAQLVVFAIGPLIGRLRLRQLLRDRRYRTAREDAVIAAVLTAVTPSGVRRLTVRVGQVNGFARNLRAGRHAVILVHERLPLRPEAAKFMIAHESAHVARYDQARRPAVVMTILICWVSLALVWLPAAVIAAPLAVAAIGLFNRAMELDCDRLGARWVGFTAAEQAFSLIETAQRQTPKKAVRTARSLLTYPSPSRRLASCRRSS